MPAQQSYEITGDSESVDIWLATSDGPKETAVTGSATRLRYNYLRVGPRAEA